MPRMPETVAALQRAETVRVARLVRLDFRSETRLVHAGFGQIRTRDPDSATAPPLVWSGLGTLGSISDIDRAVVPSGGAPTLSLSGVDKGLIAATLARQSEYRGQPARIYDQFYDADWTPLDGPFCLYAGLMDRMRIRDDGATAVITVSLVTLLYNRRRPAFSYLSAASQRRLHPGDGGADQISRLTQASETWPTY